MPIERVGEVDIELGPVTRRLADCFAEIVAEETGAGG
jgi:hypothetical protein